MWNWQQSNWPQFRYDADSFKDFELKFFENAGILYGSMKHFNEHEVQMLQVDFFSTEAYKSSEIEGELLNLDSIQSSIRKQFGLQTDHRKIGPAEQGIAEMMIDLYKNFEVPLSSDSIFLWHHMLMRGRTDIQDIGRFRTHNDPMQIVSGPLSRPVVHFEAPPSVEVPAEMQAYVKWFNSTYTGHGSKLPALIRAAIAHLYFECIHPFEDGNGRIGRAITEKSLSQSLGRPTLIAISQTIHENKKLYYDALAKNNRTLEINDWIDYFCRVVMDAQEFTQKTISFSIAKGKFFRMYDGNLNERQKRVVERIFREGFSGFKGGLSSKNYQAISGAPSATATRDLTNLVEIGAFKKTGELKGTRYFLNIDF